MQSWSSLLSAFSFRKSPFKVIDNTPSVTPVPWPVEVMDVKNKTCLFCLKQRQILVENPGTAEAIKNIYNINLPDDGCRICVECHFNILRVQEFKRTIEAAADFDVDSCFVCKSENTVNEPGVDRVVDYLIKHCTTIDFGNTDTVKACVTCMHVLETSIKYEKLAVNYASAKRFCKQYSTLKECNVALQKVDLDTLGEICEEGRTPQKKNHKRPRSSVGEEVPSKKSKEDDDGSVLPVMLTKLTPSGGKKASPPSGSKGKVVKQSDKIFIKLPLFSKPKKKLNQQRKKFGPPHSPSRAIPTSPSVDDLNRIFSVELRPLQIQIEHVDLSTYLKKTISHDKAIRQQRKPKNEEFIGLDEEDVVELQNTSFNSSISKRKSILITDRTESPNSAKKKVKFSDSPSIKYVDKIDFSEEENGAKGTDEGDEDYEEKKSTKKTPKPPNGTSPSTPENGKARPKKAEDGENGKDDEEDVEDSTAKTVSEDDKKEEDSSEVTEKVETSEGEKKQDSEGAKDEEATEQTSAEDVKKPTDDKVVEDAKLSEIPVENGEAEEHKAESPVQPPVVEENQSSLEASKAAPMEAEDADVAEPMKVDQSEEPPTDAEMKPVDSPEDVEMTETKSPEDVEMNEMDSTVVDMKDADAESAPSHEEETPAEGVESTREEPSKPEQEASSTGDFETSDKDEEEMEKFKLDLSNLLGEEISDSEQEASQKSHGDDNTSKSVADDKQHEEPTTAEDTESTEKVVENQCPEAQKTPSAEESEGKPADTESPSKKNSQSFSSLDDVDDVSDDEDILDRLDEPTEVRKRSPDLPPLGEDSL